MKISSLLLTLVFCLTGSLAPAQFLKKLSDRVTDRVEDAVIETTAQKVGEKTSQLVDKKLENAFNLHFGKGLKVLDPEELPKNYTFDWKYVLQMETNQKSNSQNMSYVYYLPKDGNYMLSQFDPKDESAEVMAGMATLIDQNLNALISLTEIEGQKTGMALSLDPEAIEEETDNDPTADLIFTEIGTKDILGYTCQGFQAENKELKMISYVLLDAPVGFAVMGQGGPKQLPAGLDPKWAEYEGNSLMMEMQYVNKRKKRQSITMTCVALEEEFKEINLSEYDFSMSKMMNPSAWNEEGDQGGSSERGGNDH